MIYDVALNCGRIIDPETKRDSVGSVGILGGKIARVTKDGETLEGKEVFDCTGLVISPGFIDTHAHGQDPVSAMYQACDGVTTSLELEFGAWPVPEFYESRDGKAVINYGCSVGHIPARIASTDRVGDKAVSACSASPHLLGQCFCTTSGTHQYKLTKAQYETLLEKLTQGIHEGGLGIGMGIAYVEECDHEEVYRVFEKCAEHDTVLFIHHRGEMHDLSDSHELIADCAATGAKLQICHITASHSTSNLPLLFEMLDRCNERGLDITAEQYPYTAGMTRIDSGVFKEGWDKRLNITPADIEYTETGERLTWENWDEHQKKGGIVLVHSNPAKYIDLAMQHPRVMIASDGIPFVDGKSHPRSAGCFTRVLGLYARERGLLSLQTAIDKMTLMPANRIASAGCSGMLKKGRIQEEMDADITIFDPTTVIDRATFAEPAQKSSGIHYVLVNGTFVVKNGEFQDGITPGCPVRGDGTGKPSV